MADIDLNFLAAQIERVLTETRDIRERLTELERCVTALEDAIALLITRIAKLNKRIECLETGR